MYRRTFEMCGDTRTNSQPLPRLRRVACFFTLGKGGGALHRKPLMRKPPVLNAFKLNAFKHGGFRYAERPRQPHQLLLTLKNSNASAA